MGKKYEFGAGRMLDDCVFPCTTADILEMGNCAAAIEKVFKVNFDVALETAIRLKEKELGRDLPELKELL